MSIRDNCTRASRLPGEFQQRLAAALQRIKHENCRYNIYLRSYLSEEALPRIFAKMAEKKQGQPLFGSTFAVKDNFRVKHQPLTFGLNPPIEGQAPAHAALVELCIQRGATLLGSTNLDPACIDYYGDNPYYGRVINPRFQDRIPCGSSAGSAAAVAGGFADFALGSDFGGSVRAPAAACGVYGLKTGEGTLPRQGIVLLSRDMDGPGLFAGALDDLRFVFETLTQQSPTTALKPQFIIPCHDELTDLEEETEQDFAYLVKKLRDAFSVQRLEFSLGFQESLEIRKMVAASDFHSAMREAGISERALPPAGQALLAFERSLPPTQKETALDRQRAVTEKIRAMLDQSSFIITPTLPAKPPAWSELQIGREAMPSRRINRFLALSNLCGLPSLSMPLEDTVTKFPFSLQLIGAPGAEQALLAAAALVKEAIWSD